MVGCGAKPHGFMRLLYLTVYRVLRNERFRLGKIGTAKFWEVINLKKNSVLFGSQSRKIAGLTAAILIGSMGSALAAANPFSDVAADHWAYDAISQLAADGVIEGYGDGTYRGDRNITRYEMAQMVAKAMARADLSATDKALVDKLATEFSEELNNLGVRVSKLEKYADKVKWTGELRYIFKSDRNEGKRRSDVNRLEMRLFPTAEINKNWQAKARITGRFNLKTDEAQSFAMTYAYAEGQYNKFKVALGKMSNYSTNDDGLVSDEYFSGIQLTYGDKLKGIIEAGRWDMSRGNGAGSEFVRDKAANYQGIQLNYADKKFSGGLGFRRFQSKGFQDVAGYSNDNKADSANVFSLGASYKFDSNISLAGAYARNNKADNYANSYSIKLGYKGAKRANAGTWGAYAAYRYISKNVSFAPTYESMFSQNHRKGWELGVQYVPVTNILADAVYFQGKTLNTDLNSKTLYGRVRWYF